MVAPTYCSLAGSARNKRQEDLIFAFSKLRELDPSARLILVGTPSFPTIFTLRARTLCEELRLRDAGRVRWSR